VNIKGKRVLITGGSSGIGWRSRMLCWPRARKSSSRGGGSMLSRRRPKRFTKPAHPSSASTADVATPEGRATTIEQATGLLGGLDILVNNAGGVRAGRLENTSEAELQAMIAVDLVAPILLTRAALPILRASGDAMIVNVASGIALIGAPFYATYAATKAGLARFGEALRRELKGEGVQVLTVYPGGTDTPMMKSNRAGPDLGFSREPATAVAAAILEGIETKVFEVIRGGEARVRMIALNRDDPAAIDERFLSLRPALEDAVKDHSAL
jgi:uncharacterized oxidoreductase